MAIENKTKQQLEDEVHALQNVINNLRRGKAETDKKNEELRLTFFRQENIARQLYRKIDEIEAHKETLRDKVDELYIINSTLCNNVAVMDANVEQWAKNASEEPDQLSKLKIITDGLREDLNNEKAMVAELKAQRDDLQRCNANLTECNEDLEERLVTKKIKAQAFKAEYEELERKHEALWRTVNYLDEIVEEDQSEVMRLRQGILYLKKAWESYEQQ